MTAAAEAAGGVLEVRDLVTMYGAVRALKGVSLSVPAGRITAVLGANGAGKTTLLRSINGLVRPRSGSIRYDGHELVGLSPERVVGYGLSHVPEGRGVIAELTVEENLRLGGLFRRNRRELDEDRGMVYEMFPQLAERRRRAASTLSGGERQMLVIGRALMARPRLLLLDEPSLGLAPRVTAQIMELLRRLCDDTALTVLLVEQNARSALSIADAAVVLSLGQVVTSLSAQELVDDEDLRHAYLGF